MEKVIVGIKLVAVIVILRDARHSEEPIHLLNENCYHWEDIMIGFTIWLQMHFLAITTTIGDEVGNVDKPNLNANYL